MLLLLGVLGFGIAAAVDEADEVDCSEVVVAAADRRSVAGGGGIFVAVVVPMLLL